MVVGRSINALLYVKSINVQPTRFRRTDSGVKKPTTQSNSSFLIRDHHVGIIENFKDVLKLADAANHLDLYKKLAELRPRAARRKPSIEGTLARSGKAERYRRASPCQG
jgi:hypothetical protein